MAQPASRISFLSSFADYVRQQRDAIGRRWMQLVRDSPEVPRAAHISPDALVSRNLPGVVVQEEQLASLGQASVEFVHANNPIPNVSGNRISRFRGRQLMMACRIKPDSFAV